MKELHDLTVIQRTAYGEHYFSLVLLHGGAMQEVQAGQFVEVKVEGCPEAMLRRPISIHDADPEAGTLTLLVQVVGAGTRRLSELQVGDRLNMVYPLGQGFTIDGTQRPLLVGGGAGIAPLLLLAKSLRSRGVEPTILLGGRTESLIPAREKFENLGRLSLSTDDGSLGHRGMVTAHPSFSETYDRIYCCGPTPMMKAVARSAASRGIDCEVSLENLMACGVGACLCCVVATDGGHRCVCKEGPVFNINRLQQWYAQ